MAPLPELFGQGVMLMMQGSGFEILQALVHKIESVVNQLRGLIRGHEGAAPEGGRSKRSTNV
jgi:hypothetical protein